MNVRERASRKPQRFRCRDCRKDFSTKSGAVGKTAVVGVMERFSGNVCAAVVDRTDAVTLCSFVDENTADGTLVYADEASAYDRLPNREAVSHRVGKYVDGMAHTNGMESFWSMMYHRMSPKHLQRYVAEFEGRHNDRPLDTMPQMKRMAWGPLTVKRLRYRGTLKQKKLGRPPALKMPEPINASPEAVARAIMRAPPKPDSEWKFSRPSPRRLPPRAAHQTLPASYLNQRPPSGVASLRLTAGP